MKNILCLLLPVIFCSIVLAQNNDDFAVQYDKIFSQISQKRVGIPNSKIDAIKNPFIMDTKVIVKENNATVAKVKYTLTAIFDKKAKINGKWYKLNSEIGSFKLSHIKNDSVIMQNEHSKKELFIRKNDVSKIKFYSK